MTTRAGLRASIREILSDESTWPDVTLNAWIQAAIHDYSNYFARQVEVDILCVAAQREYTLSSFSGLRGVNLVEYPTGEEPPRYLSRRPVSGTFYGLPVYAVLGDPPATLLIGEEPAAGEKIGLSYSAYHAAPATDSATLTVPDQHLEVLRLYVQWLAIRELEMNEAKNPDTTTLLLGSLGLNAVRAERIYRARLDDYRAAIGPGGYAGPWVLDKHDRVY